MIRQLIRIRRKQVLLDISTQKDFFLGSGKACVRNHRRVLANIRRIMAWARYNNLPIISTCQIYPNNNGASAVNYCLDGTEGQQKIRYTMLDNHIDFVADGSTDLPVDLLKNYRQVILQKRCSDPFEEPRIERLLSEMRAGEFVIIGANTEQAVMAAAIGLTQRGKKVSVVIDAIGSQDRMQADLAIRKMQAKGAQLIETKKLAGISHLRTVGICDCDLCRNFAHRGLICPSRN